MSVSIHWRLMFRVNDRRALDRCLARTLPLFEDGVEVGECKPYWKTPELWECNLVSPVPAGSAAEQVLACLLTAMSLATGWYILGSLSARVQRDSAEYSTPSGKAALSLRGQRSVSSGRRLTSEPAGAPNPSVHRTAAG
jgi:hypothetical protein